MRCNRKTACFAVTPHKKSRRLAINITKIWQLCRREKPKAEIAENVQFQFAIS
jgi:hypothetical protein